MNEKINDLLTDWFDDNEEVNSANNDDATVEQSSETIAESLLVHGLLSDMGRRDEARDAKRIHILMQAINDESLVVQDAREFYEATANPAHLSRPAANKSGRRLSILASALTITAMVIAAAYILKPQQEISAAMTSLEKVLEAAVKPFDRAYRVRVVEEYPRDKKPRNLPREAWNREAKEQIDGATLYVRGVNQYVLTVLLQNGLMRTSGCDGVVSWAFREDGPVHVSTDLSRFRGGVPGQQQDIPFLNIHSHLSQLRDGYEVKLAEEPDTETAGTVLSRLVGIRKSRDVRGPKQIEIWFDADDGTVHKMLLDGLPRGRGGPKSVMLELVDQSELAPQFFSHESHHEPGRQIRHEEKK